MMLLHLFIYKVTAITNNEITDMAVISPDDNVDARTMVRAT